MFDVFLSFDDANRTYANAIAVGLEGEGISVDQRHVAGRQSENALKSAKCVVVFWSAASIDGSTVTEEAASGLARECLVSVWLEDVAAGPPGRRRETDPSRSLDG